MNKILVAKQNNNDDSYTINDLIKNNSEVKIGDLLFTLETSKAVIDINSDYDGFILLNPNIVNESLVVVGEIVAIISSNKNISFDFEINKTEFNDENPINFTKSAYKYAIENNLPISDFSSEEIVTLDMLKSKNEFFNEKINKPKVAIVGASGQGLEVLSIIQRQSAFEFSGFIDVKFPNEKKYFGYDIIGNDNNYEEIYNNGTRNIVVAGGWLKDPKIISNIFKKAKYFNFPNIIHDSAIISNNVNLGSGIQIFSKVFIGPNVSIDDGCVINNGSIVSHDCVVGKFSFIAPGAIIAGNVEIGNYVILGINSSVYLRKTVPDYYILENNKSFT
tara:strand:+ start:11027 stop:12025 length:999 start_codon:yes stop_codon:yes gene_type:complete